MTGGAGSAAPACLLDASIFIFRYYFSMPDHWSSVEGHGTGAVYGYTRFLLRLLTEQRPRHIAACFDESLESCFRNEIYPAYKSSRVLPDEALAFQLDACQQVTRLLGIASFASDRYEADDLLGSLMQLLHRVEPASPVALLTRDKDLGQLLLRPQDCLWDYGTAGRNSDSQPLYREHIHQRFGVWPEQLVDYLALVGDSIDDIPGVPGIGAKTAGALLQFAGDIETLYQRLDELPAQGIRGAKSLAAKLLNWREQVALAQRLAKIVTDVELQVDPAELRRGGAEREQFADFCQRMGFGGSLLAGFDRAAEAV
ncbi:MAG: flap endonuclease [Gammaproteobacteria bacterium]|nr:flap endonuclease [Gammaproteobacteria bacterium]